MSGANMCTNGPGPLPQRWTHCPRKSDKLIANKFVAFKTPLSSAFHSQLDLKNIFEPNMMVDYIKQLKLRLGLWIDLTNTNRFYDRSLVEAKGIKYIKLCCRGHGEAPSIEQTQSFIEIVADFINEQPFDLVGVHCTHGFNRTGFLIISYMIERMDFSVEAALAIFANARPPGIYKQDYIDELYRRYDASTDAPIAPEAPNWSIDEDTVNCPTLKRKHEVENSSIYSEYLSDTDKSNNDDNSKAASSGNYKHKIRRRELVVKNAQFMEGVSGVEWVETPSVVTKLQKVVREMCAYDGRGFPGAQPVSMNRTNILMLKTNPYYVSWKADGTRYMMLILDRNEIYFVDRNFSCFKVNDISFVTAKNLNEHIKNTLVDGEMVLDKYNGKIVPRYLIYDIINIADFPIGRMSLLNRLKCIEEQLIEPRQQAIKQGLINRNKEPFGIRSKHFWPIEKTVTLLGESFTKSLLHEPDGLIYQPVEKPYETGVCNDILKWKPLSLNTVDFLLKIGYDSGTGVVKRKLCFLYVGGLDRAYDKMAYTRSLADFNNKIVECAASKMGWQFLRVRTDKCMPNSLSTAEAVIESIRNCVEKDYLLDFIAAHGYAGDKSSHYSMNGRPSGQQEASTSQNVSKLKSRPPPPIFPP